MEDLFETQVSLEREARELSFERLKREVEGGDLGDTVVGSYLMRNYLIPVSKALSEWLVTSSTGQAGRHNIAYRGLSLLKPEVSTYIFLKALLSRIAVMQQDHDLTASGLAIYAAGLIHDELRIRRFEEDNKAWFNTIFKDFDRRELDRRKRHQYMQKVIKDADEDWRLWNTKEMLHVGLKMLELFKNTTGDVDVLTKRRGKKVVDVVVPTPQFLSAVEALSRNLVDVVALYPPMVVPPIPWSAETLNRGGYLTHDTSPYPLVKGSRREYRTMLKELASNGTLDTVLTAVNAIQATPWRINTRVLDALDFVYAQNIECGKLPKADAEEPDPPPLSLEGLPYDHPQVLEYRRYRALIHEKNRRMIGKRVMAIRAIQTARKFSKYEELYFPHDLDSRGRIYPRPQLLHPQGPDYIKGLLEFAYGKRLGPRGLYWLRVHAANSYGHDKLPIHERAAWAAANQVMFERIAQDPHGNLEWTQADNPIQFLAVALELAVADEDFVSHLHVDLDATCSGLQHFSAMLRDEVGGKFVNMTPSEKREDVYGAVASEAKKLLEEDGSPLAQAWLRSGIMDRSITKRSVMVKPYAGTRQSCVIYVSDAVQEKLNKGHPRPWAEDEMFAFKLKGAEVVWNAIPKIVVAADEAMKWLSKISRLVAVSQPDVRRIEWTTPVGFPVHLHKFDIEYRQIKTVFDGAIYRPRFAQETDRLDPRKMASSVPPSFVHSLDGAHLQLTVEKAMTRGITYFAMVHDSFGTHAADIDELSVLIREAFIEMYRDHDVLADFHASTCSLIGETYRGMVPAIPPKGSLVLEGLAQNEFFFS